VVYWELGMVSDDVLVVGMESDVVLVVGKEIVGVLVVGMGIFDALVVVQVSEPSEFLEMETDIVFQLAFLCRETFLSESLSSNPLPLYKSKSSELCKEQSQSPDSCSSLSTTFCQCSIFPSSHLC